VGRSFRWGLKALITGVLAAAFHQAAAQAQAVSDDSTPRVARGDVIRVLDRDGRRIDGRLLDLSDEAFVVEQRGERVEVSRATVSRLERDDSLWDGVANGLLAGAFVSWEASAVTSCVVGWHCTVGLTSAYAGLGALLDRNRRETVIGSKRDPPWDGGLKGLAIGLPVGMFNNQCDRARTWVCVGQVAALYAGIGLFLDYAYKPDSTTARMRVAPLLSRRAVGLTLRARW